MKLIPILRASMAGLLITLIALTTSCGTTDPRVRSLSDAATTGDLATAQRLVERGVDPNDSWWSIPPIHAAAANGHLDVIVYLYQNGADPQLLSDEGDSALLSVVIGDSTLDIAAWLIDHGVDPCIPLSEIMQERYGVGSLEELARALQKDDVAKLIEDEQAARGC